MNKKIARGLTTPQLYIKLQNKSKIEQKNPKKICVAQKKRG